MDTRDFKAIKAQLLFHMTNFGQPIIRVIDGNFENRGELLIQHDHEGIDMQPDYMTATLKNLQKIWARPVNLVTIMDQEPQLHRYDGKDYSNNKLQTGPQLPPGESK